MKILSKAKDGGPLSPVDAYFLCEFKGLFSVALLRFNKGGREAFHSHAFNAWTWFLWGDLHEQDVSNAPVYKYKRSILPKKTPRNKKHRVQAGVNSYCITIRGPWVDTWEEYDIENNVTTTLTHGRKVVGRRNGR